VGGKSLHAKINLQQYVTDQIGLPTLQDILSELAKPGRDPRESFEAFEFADGVNEMKDLRTGMKLPGIVTNITNFGAFVDLGVHQDGLVHVSHLSDRFVSNPAEVVAVQQKVQVTVLEVDIPRKRISLSMKSDPFGEAPRPKRNENRSRKNSGGRTHGKPKGKSSQDPEGDLQAKLAMLKNKFGK
ncbi:MAG: S1 RNA-binding domain-containing protein, partial [Bacteroidota bacterium]